MQTADSRFQVVLHQELVRQWQESGICTGDTVLLHSSVSRTIRRCRQIEAEFSVENLLDSFLDAVGATGTLLLPLFNFAFCRGEAFDLRSTPSTMGALTEVARVDKRFQRTVHPIYSFAVSGTHAPLFQSLTNVSALADDGPFGLLRRLKGKIAVLDLDDQNSMTMYHHVEEVVGVDYRYHKSFTTSYTDHDGSISKRTYQLFVWDEKEAIQTDVNRAGEILWQAGLYSGVRPGMDSGLRVIDAQRMFEEVARLIKDGRAREYLYSVAGETQSNV